jgi:UDP-N-acetylglucosamine acyltransferase
MISNAQLTASMPTLIHPTAVIHPGAELAETVQVGPCAVVGEHVKIGHHTQIGAHVVIDGWTEIGAYNQIFPGAVLGLEPQDLKYEGAQSFVRIGDRNLIREYVTINRATGEQEVTQIGNDNLLMAYVHVGHNCMIGNEVIIANSVALSGHVTLESQARISGVLGIHQFVHIGRLAMVGGMSRVTRDVPPYMLAEGNPARVRTLNQVGLQRAGIGSINNGEVLQSIKKAFKLLYRSGLPLNDALEQLKCLPEHGLIDHLEHFLKQSQTPGRRGLTPGRLPPP